MRLGPPPDLEVLDITPEGPRASRRWPALAAAAVLLVGAGFAVDRLTSNAAPEDRTCVLMTFGPSVTSAQIVSIFDAAEGGTFALAEHDGHHATLLFGSHVAAEAAARAASAAAEPQIGHTGRVQVVRWSRCLAV